MTNLYAQVLAGGGGTRLWPYSRRERPKQLLSLAEGPSLLQSTVERLAPLIPAERAFVLTTAEQREKVLQQLPAVPERQVVGEPAAIGTAPAAALGAALVRAVEADATLCVLPADHVIGPRAAFHEALARAAEAAAAGWLVTFGIEPSCDAPGYGYIQASDPIPGDSGARRIKRFVEKPDEAEIRTFVPKADYYWNSGMFAWTVGGFFRECHAHLPDLARRMDEVTELAREAWSPANADRATDATPFQGFNERLAEIWNEITDRTTIDYGLMEHSDRVVCIPVSFDWNDVGSWDAVAALLPADDYGNVLVGDQLAIDTTGSLVMSGGGRLVATLGLDDVIVVDTPDVLLVCDRRRAEDVRRVVQELKDRGRDDLL